MGDLADDRSDRALWEFTRADGYVFSCNILRHARDWRLMLACNGLVFARRACESRQEADAFAEDFLHGLQSSTS